MRVPHPIDDERGFTIVEVLVAAVILLVGIMGVVTMVNQSNATTTSNKAREQGLALARELMEATRSVKYQSLRPTTIVPSIQAMPGFINAGGGQGWTIQRRGIVYSVAMGVCSVDDPGDHAGAHVAGAFCARPEVTANADRCKELIGSPAKISGTGGAAGLDGGDCGLDTNLDGQVDDLVQADATGCPGTSSVANGDCDPQPDDFKRLVVLITWDRGAGNRYVLQQGTISFPGLSAYGAIDSLTLDNYTAGASGYLVTDHVAALGFHATSTQEANQVNWLLNGTDQGPTNWAGTSGTFSWSLGNDAPEGETERADGEVLDGIYSVGARVQDAGGIHGIELDTTVTLNRRIPFPPQAFVAKSTNSGVVATWSAPPDGDIVGYHLWREGKATPVATCDGKSVCEDTNPPSSGTTNYWVTALDPDPANPGSVRDGQPSAPYPVTGASASPTPPAAVTGLTVGLNPAAKNKNNNVLITWDASPDPNVTRYYVYLDTVNQANPYAWVNSSPQPSLTDTWKTGQTHKVIVTALAGSVEGQQASYTWTAP